MSFSDIRTARQSKKSKSFVSQNDPDDIAKEISNNDEFLYTLPPTLETKRVSHKGRGVFSKIKIVPGTSVISAQPRVCVLSATHLDSFCSACFSPVNLSKRCSKCRIVRYCNSDCQLADWSLHKAECSCLQHVASMSTDSNNPSIPPDAIRCLGRILFLKMKKGDNSEMAKELASMHSLRNSLPASSHTSHAQLAHALVQYLGVGSPQELKPYGISSAKDLVDLVSKFATNTFSLTTPTLTPIGLAISPLFALINHSCNPNALFVFPRSSKSARKEPEMHLICLQEINAGDEICVSYVDTASPCSQRREILQETYGFECRCSLCSPSNLDGLDPRQAVSCPNRCGALCHLPTDGNPSIQCPKCQSFVPPSNVDSILDLVRIGQEGYNKATSLQDIDPSHSLKLTSNLIPLMTSAGFRFSCHPLLAILRLQHLLLLTLISKIDVSSQERQKVLDDAIRTATQTLSGIREIFPTGHPIRAIHLAETGKLLCVDESAPQESQTSFPPTGIARLQLAFQYLVEARKELLIGFGKSNNGGQVGEEVRDLIISLETEMGIWKDGVRTAWEEQVVNSGESLARKPSPI